MSEPQQKPEQPVESSSGWNKKTEFGEPVWVDVLKSIWTGLVMLFFTIIVGGALAVAIIAPWGRASHDCSIYCVIRNYFNAWWETKPSTSARNLQFRLYAVNHKKKAPGMPPESRFILR